MIHFKKVESGDKVAITIGLGREETDAILAMISVDDLSKALSRRVDVGASILRTFSPMDLECLRQQII